MIKEKVQKNKVLMEKLVEKDQPYIIPANWVWTRLKDFVSLSNGYAFDSKKFTIEKSVGVPLIRIRDIVRGYTETYTTETYDPKYLVYRGEILIGMDGDFNISKWGDKPALLNQRVCKLKAKTNVCLEDYLYYFLPEQLQKINNMTSSVTVKHLSLKTLEKVELPLPPLGEQQRIVDRIESLFEKLDAAKELAQNALDSFENRKAAILHKAFTGELTAKWREENGVSIDSWEEKKIKDICKISSGGTPSRKNPEYYTGNIPWIKTGEIRWNYIEDAEEKITEEAINNSSAKLFEKGTVLVAMYGQGLTRGRAAILNIDATTNQAVCALKVNEDVINKYIYYYFMCNYWKLREEAVGGNQPNLSATIISKFVIALPSLEEQQQIISVLDSLLDYEQQAQELCNVIEKVDFMKKAILARAFRGELGTNNPEEESAIELLKEVLAEKLK